MHLGSKIRYNKAVNNPWAKKQNGFTIVELLVVIVVIGILASITIVTYNGVQQRARDVRRKSDVSVITQGLELYYLDNGRYPGTPNETGGSTTINSSWSTTADASWQKLVDTLKPYIDNVPKDPISTSGESFGSYNYDYFASSSDYCGAAPYQMYILVYKFETDTPYDTLQGDCLSTRKLGPYGGGSSNYRVVR